MREEQIKIRKKMHKINIKKEQNTKNKFDENAVLEAVRRPM